MFVTSCYVIWNLSTKQEMLEGWIENFIQSVEKVYFDNTLDRICTTFVPAEELVISNDNTDLISAERYTQVMKQSVNEI